MVPPSIFPRLRSLRSLSLGLLRVSLFEAINHCYAWRMGIPPPLYWETEDSYAWRRGINPTPTLGDRGVFRLEDGDKPPPLHWETEDSYAWRRGITPTPTLCDRGLLRLENWVTHTPTLGDRGVFRLEDGDKPQPYIGFRRGDKERRHKKLVPPYIISLKTSDLYQLKDVRPLSA